MGLSEFRQQIDKVDNGLLELLRERMLICEKIAAYKKEHRLPVLDAARENEKLAVITEKAGDELGPYAEKFFKMLFEISRAYQSACAGLK